MDARVWKFEVGVDDSVEVMMPRHAEILHVEIQLYQPCIWALVDAEQVKIKRKFRIVGTGHPIPDIERLKFVRTFIDHTHNLVWHLFEVVR